MAYAVLSALSAETADTTIQTAPRQWVSLIFPLAGPRTCPDIGCRSSTALVPLRMDASGQVASSQARLFCDWLIAMFRAEN